MKIAGILVAVMGFVISLASLALGSLGARFALVTVGLILSLFGILGILNPAHLKHAIWKTGAGAE
jgi:uncharacterized membrane protein YgaE (UPF0421/DUF939 family)